MNSISNPFEILDGQIFERADDFHIYGRQADHICLTDKRGQKRGATELVVDASEGFIPLWQQGSILRWRFNDHSFSGFRDPHAAKQRIRDLFAAAIIAWGDAAPIQFSENVDSYDFEIIMQPLRSCSVSGCLLARAFFPDSGRHELEIYPSMLDQVEQEQIETLVHELGHIFGLRHFFALERESIWPSAIYGAHEKVTIMNYGKDSQLTEQDKKDLKDLYQKAWSSHYFEINKTKVVLVAPYHTLRG